MSPILTGVIASGISGNLTPPWSPEGGYDALMSTTLTATASSITISGVPTGYKHLEIRMFARYTGSVGAGYIHFNGDNASGNYSTHAINSDGGSVPGALGYTSQNRAYYTAFAGTSPNARNVMIMSIQDYANINKNKTIRSMYGWDNNGSGYIEYTSNNWRSLNPVTSITLTPGNTFDSGTTVSVYGVK